MVSEFPQVVTIIVTLICSLIVIYVIVRHMDFKYSSVISVDQVIPEIFYKKVVIPFNISLVNDEDNNYSGVKVKIDSSSPCRLYSFWGVKISTFFEFLHNIKFFNITQPEIGSLVQSTGIHYTFTKSCINEEILIKPMNKSMSMENTIPRRFYPLVIVIISDSVVSENSNECMKALVCVIHLPDDKCHFHSQILDQYLISTSNLVNLMKPFYIMNCDGFCSVCYINKPSKVLLPCRHTLCKNCLERIQKCPVCRSNIIFYFSLNLQPINCNK